MVNVQHVKHETYGRRASRERWKSSQTETRESDDALRGQKSPDSVGARDKRTVLAPVSLLMDACPVGRSVFVMLAEGRARPSRNY